MNTAVRQALPAERRAEIVQRRHTEAAAALDAFHGLLRIRGFDPASPESPSAYGLERLPRALKSSYPYPDLLAAARRVTRARRRFTRALRHQFLERHQAHGLCSAPAVKAALHAVLRSEHPTIFPESVASPDVLAVAKAVVADAIEARRRETHRSEIRGGRAAQDFLNARRALEGCETGPHAANTDIPKRGGRTNE